MKALLEALKPGGKDWALAKEIDPRRLPEHIAVIMDGNGRWAKKRSLPRVAGHRAGAEAVRVVVDTCGQLGIRALTLYAFSAENWKRPRMEVDTLWRLLRHYVRKELPALQKSNVRLTTIGRLEALPPVAREELDSAVQATSANRGLRVILALNYGGRNELVDAFNSLLDEARVEGRLQALCVDEAAIAAHLYTRDLPDPDLLIRTSGEMRVSNFLLWQIAYAELYITETLWPDFSRTDLLQAVLEYQKRDRRYGGLSGARLNAPVNGAAQPPGPNLLEALRPA
jgi:undecaprenyl diphosphate synthase